MRAIIESCTYRNEENGFTVLSCSSSDPSVPTAARTKDWGSGWCFGAVGNFLPSREGAELELGGAWAANSHGLQLKVETCSEIMPKTAEGLIGYLSSGLLKNIGPQTAKAIVDRFGLASLDVLEHDPQQLLAIRGITPSRLEEITSAYQESVSVREIVAFLTPYGITVKKCLKIQTHFQGRAIDVLRNEPFTMCEIPGFAFKTVDKIARDLQHDPAGAMRIRGALRYILDSDLEEGHAYVEREALLERAMILLNEGFSVQVVSEDLVRSEANAMVQQKLLRYEKGAPGETGRFYLPVSITAERAIAFSATTLLRGTQFPAVSDELIETSQQSLGIHLEREQTAGVHMALENRISILTGGPGTGKTTVLQVILDVFRRLERGTVLLTAPTGRASRRMAETCHHAASTLHSALGIIADDDAEYMTSAEPLEADFVIIDEASMLDQNISSSFFSRLAPGASVLFVGDVDQLPPVGPGMVFRDLIESGAVPVTRLTTIFRQSKGSHIPINAALICRGSTEIIRGQDFKFIPAKTPEEAAQRILELYTAEMRTTAPSNLQVLTPLRKKGAAATNELNSPLHDLANPMRADLSKVVYGTHEYRVGDKVLQLRNCGEVSNGDIGEVTAAGLDEDGKKTLQVNFSNDRMVMYHGDDLEMLDWAYAMSVHKSQGSEFPTVIIPVLFQFYNMLRRDLYYTAVSRAKQKVILVGQWAAFRRAVETPPERRRTTLAWRIQTAMQPEKGSEQMKTPA